MALGQCSGTKLQWIFVIYHVTVNYSATQFSALAIQCTTMKFSAFALHYSGSMWVAVVAVDISQFNSGCPGESKLQSITDYDHQDLSEMTITINVFGYHFLFVFAFDLWNIMIHCGTNIELLIFEAGENKLQSITDYDHQDLF